jgi:hypothetical protein
LIAFDNESLIQDIINFLVFSAVYEDEISSLFRITSKSNIAEEVGSAS